MEYRPPSRKDAGPERFFTTPRGVEGELRWPLARRRPCGPLRRHKPCQFEPCGSFPPIGAGGDSRPRHSPSASRCYAACRYDVSVLPFAQPTGNAALPHYVKFDISRCPRKADVFHSDQRPKGKGVL